MRRISTALTEPGWPIDPITLADWELLPEDEALRTECCEGNLVVTSSPGLLHQLALVHLSAAVDDQLPAELCTVPRVEVILEEEPLTIRVPDVVVLASDLLDREAPRLPASNVLLIAEILAPGSRRTDRVAKFSEYAEAGIRDYWILDPEVPSLNCYQLSEVGTYHPNGDFEAWADVSTGIGTLTVDLARIAKH